MAWFQRTKYTIIKKEDKKDKIPEGMWVKCGGCGAILLKKELEENLSVCPKCGFHHRIDAVTRLKSIIDPETFELMFEDVATVDFLDFPQYKDKLEKSAAKTDLTEAVITGTGKLDGLKVAIGITDFNFLGGSLGSVMGERITRLIELALEQRLPLILMSSSGGGARMHEGIVSLMQMAKISAALAKMYDSKLPYIAVLTDPTGGGVTASFAMLGDINIAEPGALIMFAGPRVIEQTIRQKLPPEFQRSEFLLEHGMLDMIVNRTEMKKTIASLLRHLTSNSK